MIETDFYGILTSATAVKAYPEDLPEDSTLPAIAYSFIASSPSATFDTHGTERSRVEVRCWAADLMAAVTIRHALIQALDGYSAAGVTIRYLGKHNFFDHDAREYNAMVEFYLFSSI